MLPVSLKIFFACTYLKGDPLLAKSSDSPIWGIHAGKTGDADSLFLGKGFVAIGWVKMGDLSPLKADRDTFKAKVAEA